MPITVERAGSAYVSPDTAEVQPGATPVNSEVFVPQADSIATPEKTKPVEKGSNTTTAAQDATFKEIGDDTQKLAECSLSDHAEAHFEEDKKRKERVLEQYRQTQEQSFPSMCIITGEELLVLISSDSVGVDREVVLVDCRSAAERKVSIIPGAISQAQLEDNLHQVKDRTIVAYCASGRRSGNFLKTLTQKHAELKVRNFAGSLVYWMHLGGPLVDGELGLPTNRLNLGGNGWLPFLPKSRSIDFVTEAS